MKMGCHSSSKEKPLKRGAGGREVVSNAVIHSHEELLLPKSTPHDNELKQGVRAQRQDRVSRSSRYFALNGLTVAIISLFCIMKLGSLAYIHFLRGRILDEERQQDGTGLMGFHPALLRFTESSNLEAKEVQWKKQMRSLVNDGITCDPRFALLKVYMYDLPSEFHFGLLKDTQPSSDLDDVWPKNLSNLPKYPAALNHQHSAEYWLTADLLASNQPGRNVECTALRVRNPAKADVVFVPFFTTLGWIKFSKQKHKNGEDPYGDLQDRLVKYLLEQRPWQKSRGRDHVFVMHQPNGLAKVRDQVKSSMFLVNDFGRFHKEVANLQKDIVVPYKHVVPSFSNDSTTFESRMTLLFFRGVVKRKEVCSLHINKSFAMTLTSSEGKIELFLFGQHFTFSIITNINGFKGKQKNPRMVSHGHSIPRINDHG